MNFSGYFGRVLLLVREHWVLNRKAYLVYGIFCFLVTFLLLLGGKRWSAEDGLLSIGQMIVFAMLVYISVSFSGVWFSQTVRCSPGNLLALTLPCMPSQRLLAGVLWGGLMVPVLLLGIMYLALGATLFFFPENDFLWLSPWRFLNGGPPIGGTVIPTNVFLSSVMYQLLFMAGGYYFKSFAWIKTWITMFVFGCVMFSLAVILCYAFVDGYTFSSLALMSRSVAPQSFLQDFTGSWMYLHTIFLSFLYFSLAYFLLKEKQV